MEKIVSMLRNGSNIVYIVPIQVNSYREVIDRWLSYKRFEGLTFTKQMSIIRDIFRFHRSNIDHIILYYSRYHNDCLLMCRVGGKYTNMLLPALNIKDHNRSIIAVYT